MTYQNPQYQTPQYAPGGYESAGVPVTAATRAASTNGIVTKTLILLALTVGSAFLLGPPLFELVGRHQWAWLALMVAIIAMSMVSSKVVKWAKVYAPVFSVVQGAMFGAVTLSYLAYPIMVKGGSMDLTSLVPAALGATVAVAAGTALLYWKGVIKPGRRFQAIVSSAMVGVVVFYLVLMALQLFGVEVSGILLGTPLAIGVSVVMVIIASMEMVSTWMNVDAVVKRGASPELEWFAGLQIISAMGWLYVEILRLLINIAAVASDD